MKGAALAHSRSLAESLNGSGWKLLERRGDGEQWLGRVRGQPLIAIWSIATEEDGQDWLHVSVSHKSRVPTWNEMSAVKALFVGDRWAAQLHPPQDQYVNDHPNVLHLWSPLGAWPLPDFTQGSGSI